MWLLLSSFPRALLSEESKKQVAAHSGRAARTAGLTCQHADDRQENLLHALHGAPPLCAALVSHGIVPRSMKDRDAHSPVWVNCTESTEHWLVLSGNALRFQISLETWLFYD